MPLYNRMIAQAPAFSYTCDLWAKVKVIENDIKYSLVMSIINPSLKEINS